MTEMTPQEQQAINDLQNRAGFNLGTATAWVRSRGRCEYCKQDLLNNRLGYAVGQIDHLLPKSKYPQYEHNSDNLILTCSSCNGVKHDFDPISPSENDEEMLKNHRQELIDRVRQYLRVKFQQYDKDWHTALDILGDLWWE